MRILFTLLLSLVSFMVAFGQAERGGIASSEISPDSEVQVYPSPANEYVFVKLRALKASEVKLTVYTIIGNEMRAETDIISEDELRVRVKDLPSGYYLLSVKDEATKFHSTHKFLRKDGA